MKSTPTVTTGNPANRPSGGLSRRGLLANGLKVAAAAGFSPWVGGCHTDSPESTVQNVPPSGDRLRIAAVGIGGMGQQYMAGCRGEQFVALCDLDHNFAGPVFDKYPSAARYHDFRRMFDREAKNFDALIIATPDHTHAVILMAALQLGKHVYCAKPVAHTIGEIRTIRQAFAGASSLVTLTSVQSAASDAACNTAELLNTGVIGPVRELHLWCDHPSYPCGLLRPTEEQTPPRGMSWDLWLGPAPYRPFNAAYHPWKWRAWWDFGGGTVADMACHRLHIYFKQLQLGAPSIIYANGSTVCDDTNKRIATPECQSHANIITWEYPARGELPPMKVHWYDGGMKPQRPAELDHGTALPRNGMMFVGEKGKLLAGSNGGRFAFGRGLSGGLLLPENEFRDFPEPPMTLPRVRDHYGEWTSACKTGARTACPIEFGCEMSEVALLGSLALRTGRLLEWDSTTATVSNSPAANALISPPRRDGWSL